MPTAAERSHLLQQHLAEQKAQRRASNKRIRELQREADAIALLRPGAVLKAR